MPCNGDYLNATFDEVEAAKMFHVLDELMGRKVKEFGSGYDDRVYGRVPGKKERDRIVADICRRMKRTNPKRLSLEAQIWWRDHQKADKKRPGRGPSPLRGVRAPVSR